MGVLLSRLILLRIRSLVQAADPSLRTPEGSKVNPSVASGRVGLHHTGKKPREVAQRAIVPSSVAQQSHTLGMMSMHPIPRATARFRAVS